MIVAGRFERPDHTPVTGAAVHTVFLGDPPGNSGTAFDLVRAPAHTDDSGQFRITITDPDEMLREFDRPGAWRRGCFLVVGVKDGRTIGYTVASGDELGSGPVCLTTLATTAVGGRVVDDAGRAVQGATIESDHYFLPVGRGPHPHAPVNFWISRGRGFRVTDLTTMTGEDGSFSLTDIPTMPGGLQLRVTHPGLAGLHVHYDPLQPLPPLVMKAGAEVRVRVLLPDGSPARGLCLELGGLADDRSNSCGITGIPVGAVGCEHRYAETDEEGRCLFGGLPPGDYSIRYVGLVEKIEAIRRQGLLPWDQSMHSVAGPRDRLALPVIEVGHLAEGERREIQICAVEGSILYGTVRQADTGEPIENATVRYEGASYPLTGSSSISAALQSAHTDAHGRFASRTALVPGPLIIWIAAKSGGKRVRLQREVVVGPEPRTALDLTIPFESNDAHGV
jgi:hypothetical protein